ncbi:hypothetical protein WICMUC_000171 [Wickerhamomyces mucosus]|uniref:LDB19 N-terminal domain-containing protein n=1 Tax=Wickerhamomyces mucosus TaxID=1378264 RepID=A0A9P8Q0B2_9ASCO|nr:hypothetical protein WICMUC_000171 [Wickerhamomyces mucosus]
MPFLPKLTASLSSGSVPVLNNHHHHHNHNNKNNNENHSTTSHSSSLLNSKSSSSTSLHTIHSKHPFDLSIDLESPPIILYGPANESTGSLISGQLSLKISKNLLKDQKISNFNSNSNSITTSISNTPTIRPPNKRTNSANAIHKSLTQTLSNLNISNHHSHSHSHNSIENSDVLIPKVMMNIKDHLLITSVILTLEQQVHYSKPFLPPSNTLINCSNCKNKITELARWDIMSQPHSLPLGDHSYPFSHLLPGNLPATSTLGSSNLTTIKYQLIAKVKYNFNNHNLEAKIVLPLNISRSILRGADRNSLRVFPPTDVTATAVLPNVIHPKSSFTLELRLDGVTNGDRRWRMRRVGWRIEETVKLKIHSCEFHKTKLKVLEDYTKKNQNKQPIKRNQQSGPTSQIIVTNFSNHNNNINISNFPNNNNINNNSRDLDTDLPDPNSENLNTLHPSDHANIESQTQENSTNNTDNIDNNNVELEQIKQEQALYSEETRTVATGDLRKGWKSDFSGKGKIELIADISCFNLTSSSNTHHTHVSTTESIDQTPNHPTITTDINDPVLGILANHVLIVEIVVAEEILQSNSLPSSSTNLAAMKSKDNDQRLAELSPIFANHISSQQSQQQQPQSSSTTTTTTTTTNPLKPSLSNSSSKRKIDTIIGVPTGSARVLRMQFKLILTERSGLGIAWDDEVPPMYDDVSALSPPTYDSTSSIISPPSELTAAHLHSTSNSLTNILSLGGGVISPINTNVNSPYGNGTTPGVLFGIGDNPASPSYSPRVSDQFNDNIDEMVLN